MKPLDPRLLKYAQSARKYLIFIIITGAATSILVLLQAFAIAGAITPVISYNHTLQQAYPWIFTLGTILLFRFGLIYLQESVAHRAARSAITDLRSKVIKKSVSIGHRWLADGHTSPTVTLVTRGIDNLEPYFVKYLPQIILSATVTPLVTVVIFFLDWVSVLFIVFCLPLIPFFMILIGKITQAFASDKLKQLQTLGSELLDLLAGLPTIKSFGREISPARRVAELGRAYTKATMQTLRVAFISGAALELISTLCTALVAVEVGFRMVYGYMSLSTGLIIIMLTPEVYKPLREVGSQFHASADGVAAAEEAFKILEATKDNPTSRLLSQSNSPLHDISDKGSSMQSLPSQNPSTQAKKSDKISGYIPLQKTKSIITAPSLSNVRIILDEVSCYAPGRNTWAPYKISAEILPGKITAIVGASGAGKTTAISTLLNLLEPDIGNVFVHVPSDVCTHSDIHTDTDHKDRSYQLINVRDLEPESYWKQVLWVPQRPTIWPGSVIENLTLYTKIGSSAPTPPTSSASSKTTNKIYPEPNQSWQEEDTLDPKLLLAAQKTGFSEVISGLSQGWNTKIGLNGVGISVGQRQRLALTRALASQAPVVILDEPTAHLDAQSEKLVLDTVIEIKSQGKTVVVIAHRPALIRTADSVVRVESLAKAPEENLSSIINLQESTSANREEL